MKYSWDIRKNRANLAKHGIAFEEAVRIFDGPVVERFDDRHEYGETRIVAIGVFNGIQIAVVVYVDKEEDCRRIITARLAEPWERRSYWRSVGH